MSRELYGLFGALALLNWAVSITGFVSLNGIASGFAFIGIVANACVLGVYVSGWIHPE